MKQGEITAYLSLIFVLLIAFVGGLMESASIQITKNYRRCDVNRAVESVFAEYQKELLEKYHIFGMDGSYETGQYSERNLIDRFAFYGTGNIDYKIKRIEFLTDDACRPFREAAEIYMEQKYGISQVKEMLGMTSVWGEQEKQADHCMEEEKSQKQNLENLLETKEGELPEQENPIAHTDQLKKSPILELVLPKEKQLSEKKIEETNSLPVRDKNVGYGEFSDVAEKTETVSTLLFNEYLLEHFSSFIENEGTKVLDYELEYILGGKANDRNNLETVVKQLMMIRFVPNFAYIQTDGEKRSEAEAMALALCSLMLLPELTQAVTQGILLAWAYGETIMDLRSLLSGNKVPVVKSRENWQLSLSALLTLGTQADNHEGRASKEGLAYQDYLRMLLFLKTQKITALRALGVIEQNLRIIFGQEFFHADFCMTKLEIESCCNLRRGIRYQFKTYYGYQ